MVENQSTSIRKYPKRIPYGMMNFKAVIEDVEDILDDIKQALDKI